MQNIPSTLIFRIFSANDWNQLELFHFYIQSSFIPSVASTFSSNAEKVRKIASSLITEYALEYLRINWSIGFRILFSFIPESSKSFTLVR